MVIAFGTKEARDKLMTGMQKLEYNVSPRDLEDLNGCTDPTEVVIAFPNDSGCLVLTHVLTNGDAILEIEVSDNKDTMTAVFKRSDPDIYDEAEFAVTRNPNYPFELLRDIIDQCGFMDQPYFHADGWELN